MSDEERLENLLNRASHIAVMEYKLSIKRKFMMLDRLLDQMGVWLQKTGIGVDDPVWNLHEQSHEVVKQLMLEKEGTQ